MIEFRPIFIKTFLLSMVCTIYYAIVECFLHTLYIKHITLIIIITNLILAHAFLYGKFITEKNTQESNILSL